MTTTVEIGIVMTLGIVVIEVAVQSYRRYKDNTKEEMIELKEAVGELNDRLDRVEETQSQTQQYLLGYKQRDGDEGVLGDVQSSLNSLQSEMEKEHSDMYNEIRQNNIVLAELVESLHQLNDVDEFDREEIRGEEETWRAD